jgi:hypothetical protein
MADEKQGTDDSDTRVLSFSFDSGRNTLDVSPTESQFSEKLLYTAKQSESSPTKRREETVDASHCPSVIPPEHPSRTLVLCFDGTGDQFEADNSNVVQLVSLLKKDDSTKQLVYYQVRFPLSLSNFLTFDFVHF